MSKVRLLKVKKTVFLVYCWKRTLNSINKRDMFVSGVFSNKKLAQKEVDTCHAIDYGAFIKETVLV